MNYSRNTYPRTGPGRLWVAEPDRNHTLWFLIVENHICYLTQLAALLSNVLFNIENGGWVLLCGCQHSREYHR